MVIYNDDVLTSKCITLDNKIETVYPMYINNNDFYYDNLKHYNCRINIFLLNIFKDILENNNLGPIEKYLLPVSNSKLNAFYAISLYNLESSIYKKMYILSRSTLNIKNAVLSLIEILDYNFKSIDDLENNLAIFEDVLVRFLMIDKININDKTIVTSKRNIMGEYYNYMIMNYNIDSVSNIFYDEDKFHILNADLYTNNVRMEEEIEFVKKYVPMNERHSFLK